MTITQGLARAPTHHTVNSGVAVADAPEELAAFLQPDCAAAIWRRRTPPDVQAWLDQIDPGQLPQGRVVVTPDAVATTVAQFCDLSGLADGPGRAWLCSDIATLAKAFSDLVSAPFVRLRLDVVTTNACRKFHIDALTARLVCTYRGTGTQYGTSTDGADPGRVFTVPTGAPILLRGTLWPEQPRSGLLHRSPPIEGSGEARLLLVLDGVEAPANAL